MSKLKWVGNQEAQQLAEDAWKSIRRNNRKAKPIPTKVNYAEYLLSKKWRRIRKKALKKAKWKCHRCGSQENLEVHHKTYIRLGNEQLKDLEVLCHLCHSSVHSHKVECMEMDEEFKAVIG